MMRSFFFLSFFCLLATAYGQSGRQVRFVLNEEEAAKDFVVRRIPLSHYSAPVASVLSAVYDAGGLQTADTPAGGPPLEVVLGMERKQSFALVKIPTRRPGSSSRLSEVVLQVKETAQPITPAALLKTTASSSVLASGDWYKIAVPDRGVYKIDYTFLSSTLGISGTISSAAIRLYGNGGQMLPEAVGVARPDDLTELSVQVQDGGDGTFGSGDYLLFYAPGHNGWQWDAGLQRYVHTKNIYEDKSYYFLSVGGTGKRLTQESSAVSPTVTVSSFDDYLVQDDDKVNIGAFGRRFWGDDFGSAPGKVLSRSYSFALGTVVDSLRSRVAMAVGNTQTADQLRVMMNGQPVANHVYSTSLAATDYPYGPYTWTDGRSYNSSSVSFDLQFTASSSASRGYLDFIELNWRRALQYGGGQLHFRDRRSAGAGQVAAYQISGANNNVQVWDVTTASDPVRIDGSLSGSTFTLARDASRVREFVAFDGPGAAASPAYAGRVSNQNLHGEAQTDYVIVTHPSFRDAAEKLAAFHRQARGLRVTIANTDQIYNEFSSGSQDIGAIRDFVRMFYARAGADTTQMPRYLLMFGDASYDYKDRLSANTNYVPTYEGEQSEELISTFAGDDFFGILDTNEHFGGNRQIYNTLDVGVGRVPVKTAAEANAIVDKIKRYQSPASFGPWRIHTTYAGDDEDDAGEHLLDAEANAAAVQNSSPLYVGTKVYVDNLPVVSTPGGSRCPDANKMINDAVFRGTFLINYSGHGSPTTLAHERIVTADDFNSWKNGNKMPIMVTATCDFAQFDQPGLVSAGEKLILKGDGGSIAMLTTVHAVYASQSRELNGNFLQDLITPLPDGSRAAFGDALRLGKNQTYSRVFDSSGYLLNFRKFILLGDPALMPAFPKERVQTDSVMDMTSGVRQDTLKALGGYTVQGSVREAGSGALMSGFNGRVYVTIYDKPRVIKLITRHKKQERTFRVQSNVVYKGITTAINGRFSFSFIAPKDLNYEMGAGRISYYAEDGSVDAAGTDTSVQVGGFSDAPVVENHPPSIRPYMNDSLFRNGGLTGSNSVLYVILEDETGINVSGNAVGHDLTAVLDGGVQDPFVLNDYYETAPGSYRRGFVRFPVTGLADGQHSLRVKAWDVNNNSGEGTVTFEVVNGRVTRVQHLSCYPNPFTNQTRFVWEHNHNDEAARAQIQIFNTTGSLVRRIDEGFVPTGSRSAEVVWDGTSDGGAALPPGVYLYRLVFSGPLVSSATAYEKVVLVR